MDFTLMFLWQCSLPMLIIFTDQNVGETNMLHGIKPIINPAMAAE